VWQSRAKRVPGSPARSHIGSHRASRTVAGYRILARRTRQTTPCREVASGFPNLQRPESAQLSPRGSEGELWRASASDRL
jgi:hypothetical protein